MLVLYKNDCLIMIQQRSNYWDANQSIIDTTHDSDSSVGECSVWWVIVVEDVVCRW